MKNADKSMRCSGFASLSLATVFSVTKNLKKFHRGFSITTF